jgi:hypothetical protein
MQINIKLLAIVALLIINLSLYIHFKEINRLKLIEKLTPTDLSGNIIDPSGNNTSKISTSTFLYIGAIIGGSIIFSILVYLLYKYFSKDKGKSKSKSKSSSSSSKTSNNNISYYEKQQQKYREKKEIKESLKLQKESLKLQKESNQINKSNNQSSQSNNQNEESEGLLNEKKGKSDEVKNIISDYEKIIDKNKNVQKTFFMLTSSIPILLKIPLIEEAFKDKYRCPEIQGSRSNNTGRPGTSYDVGSILSESQRKLQLAGFNINELDFENTEYNTDAFEATSKLNINIVQCNKIVDDNNNKIYYFSNINNILFENDTFKFNVLANDKSNSYKFIKTVRDVNGAESEVTLDIDIGQCYELINGKRYEIKTIKIEEIKDVNMFMRRIGITNADIPSGHIQSYKTGTNTLITIGVKEMGTVSTTLLRYLINGQIIRELFYAKQCTNTRGVGNAGTSLNDDEDDDDDGAGAGPLLAATPPPPRPPPPRLGFLPSAAAPAPINLNETRIKLAIIPTSSISSGYIDYSARIEGKDADKYKDYIIIIQTYQNMVGIHIRKNKDTPDEKYKFFLAGDCYKNASGEQYIINSFEIINATNNDTRYCKITINGNDKCTIFDLIKLVDTKKCTDTATAPKRAASPANPSGQLSSEAAAVQRRHMQALANLSGLQLVGPNDENEDLSSVGDDDIHPRGKLDSPPIPPGKKIVIVYKDFERKAEYYTAYILNIDNSPETDYQMYETIISYDDDINVDSQKISIMIKNKKKGNTQDFRVGKCYQDSNGETYYMNSFTLNTTTIDNITLNITINDQSDRTIIDLFKLVDVNRPSLSQIQIAMCRNPNTGAISAPPARPPPPTRYPSPTRPPPPARPPPPMPVVATVDTNNATTGIKSNILKIFGITSLPSGPVAKLSEAEIMEERQLALQRAVEKAAVEKAAEEAAAEEEARIASLQAQASARGLAPAPPARGPPPPQQPPPQQPPPQQVRAPAPPQQPPPQQVRAPAPPQQPVPVQGPARGPPQQAFTQQSFTPSQQAFTQPPQQASAQQASAQQAPQPVQAQLGRARAPALLKRDYLPSLTEVINQVRLLRNASAALPGSVQKPAFTSTFNKMNGTDIMNYTLKFTDNDGKEKEKEFILNRCIKIENNIYRIMEFFEDKSNNKKIKLKSKEKEIETLDLDDALNELLSKDTTIMGPETGNPYGCPPDLENRR